MLTSGQHIELAIEKPAAGGRMIARHDGQIVLVGGAVPGERVVARIERAERRLAFATVVDVTESSPDRRRGFADPLCGGCVYSHIAYARQLVLKAEVIRDAFLRIGRVPLETSISVAPSPERGHRMRARLHVDRGRIGFYREGTHVLCDAASTGQLRDASLSSIATAVATIERSGAHATSVELTENIAGDQRALSIELDAASTLTLAKLADTVQAGAFTGCIVRDRQGMRLAAGEPSVSDSLGLLTKGRVSTGELHRHPESFFQANRYVVPDLVSAVLDAVPAEGDVLDLYAGVGLFSVALAGTDRRGITAVEGDRGSAADLQRNAGPFGGAVTLVLDSVEGYLEKPRAAPPIVIVDPPRTGISAEAMTALTRLGAGRVIYVSCDPATMARDARRLIDAGYAIESLRAFDLFPNTPHLESVGTFVRL